MDAVVAFIFLWPVVGLFLLLYVLAFVSMVLAIAKIKRLISSLLRRIRNEH